MNGTTPSVGGVGFNDLGWVGFSAFFEGPLVDETNHFGLFLGPADDLRLVARQGFQAPGMEAGVEFSNFLTPTPRVASPGDVGFIGSVAGPGIDETNNVAVWTGPREAPQLVSAIRTGTQPPGLAQDVTFSSLINLIMNGRHELLVYAFLTGDGVDTSNDEGHWLGTPEAMQLLVREGEDAFGLPDGVVFTFDGDPLHLRYPRIEMNGMGDVAMATPLLGVNIDETNNVALYYRAADAIDWTLVFRTGDLLDGLTIAPYGIDFLSLVYSSDGSGWPRSMNDDGEFVVYLEFDDDVQGIYYARLLPTRDRAGDFDHDNDVDLIDFGAFQGCFGADSDDCLIVFDFDHSESIDLADFQGFQERFTGP